MLIRTKLIATLLVTILLPCLIATNAVSAQESPGDLIAQLPGLEGAISRRYMSANALGLTEIATPAATTERSRTEQIQTTVLEFRDTSTADLVFGTMANDRIAEILIGDSGPLKTIAAGDLGDKAVFYTTDIEYSEDAAKAALLLVQDGNLGFVIQGIGTDETVEQTVADFAEFMVAAEPGTGMYEVDAIGHATGGLFDVFPENDDPDILAGLVPMYDYDLFLDDQHPLEGSATPEAPGEHHDHG